jgi:hypothetical protein
MAFKTLEQLRTELQTRLGFRAAGETPGINRPIIDSMLQTAQQWLYSEFDWPKLTTYADRPVGVDQTLVDYPSDANNERVQKLAIQRSGLWMVLRHGIEPTHYDSLNTRTTPTRYELRAQIELWPMPDQVYTLRIWYVKALGGFTLNADRATLDDALVLPYALALAKAHYRQPDAALYMQQWQRTLSRLRGQMRGQREHFSAVGRRHQRAYDPYLDPNPRVV